MNYQEAIKEAETQINVYENMILYNKDFEPKNDNSNYENKIDFLKTAIYAMQELQEYKKLCALEAVRRIVEMNESKKPIVESIDEVIFGRKIENVVVYCPTCGERIASLADIEMHGFCRNCGQSIDWSEEDD